MNTRLGRALITCQFIPHWTYIGHTLDMHWTPIGHRENSKIACPHDKSSTMLEVFRSGFAILLCFLGVQWVSNGCPMGVQWVSNGRPMGVQ